MVLKYWSKTEWLAKLHSNSLFTWGVRICCLEGILDIPVLINIPMQRESSTDLGKSKQTLIAYFH